MLDLIISKEKVPFAVSSKFLHTIYCDKRIWDLYALYTISVPDITKTGGGRDTLA